VWYTVVMKIYQMCNISSCENVVGLHGAKGFCPLHYRRYRIYGDPLYTKFNKVCKVRDCNLIKQTKVGYCTKHYKRHIKGGNPNIPSNKEPRSAVDMGDHCLIPLGVLAKSGYAIIDKADIDIQKYFWSKDNCGYAQANIDGVVSKMHQVIIGKAIKPLVTDHINRNKVDNRRVNLRFVTETENALNKRYEKP